VLQSWAICREEAAGELTYLGIVSTESEADALPKVASAQGEPKQAHRPSVGRSAAFEVLRGKPPLGLAAYHNLDMRDRAESEADALRKARIAAEEANILDVLARSSQELEQFRQDFRRDMQQRIETEREWIKARKENPFATGGPGGSRLEIPSGTGDPSSGCGRAPQPSELEVVDPGRLRPAIEAGGELVQELAALSPHPAVANVEIAEPAATGQTWRRYISHVERLWNAVCRAAGSLRMHFNGREAL
jgi:hypothetical protein